MFNVCCYNCKSVLQEHNVIVESSFVMRLISMGFLFPLLLVTRFHPPLMEPQTNRLLKSVDDGDHDGTS